MERLPLFPLNDVLLPGATVDLKIFEQRYLNLVRDCTRDAVRFGVVLIDSGGEVGPARFRKIGTYARIEDWTALPGGLLGVMARGLGRFELSESRMEPAGLYVGQARPKPFTKPAVSAPQMQRIARVLGISWPPPPDIDIDRAAWLSFRLAEREHADTLTKQRLLESDDPSVRLVEVAAELERIANPERGPGEI